MTSGALCVSPVGRAEGRSPSALFFIPQDWRLKELNTTMAWKGVATSGHPFIFNGPEPVAPCYGVWFADAGLRAMRRHRTRPMAATATTPTATRIHSQAGVPLSPPDLASVPQVLV